MKAFISNILPQRDKLLHFIGGTYISLILSGFAAWWITLLIVFIIALGVEVYDKFSGKGTAEVLDIIYTLAGSICVLIINLIKII